MKIVYTAPLDVQNFFKENASVVYGSETYYYMPYWFKVLADGKFEQIRFEDLPKEVIEILKINRDAKENTDKEEKM